MRVKLLRLLCVSMLISLPHIFLQGCSSTPQEDGDLEGGGYEEGNAGEAGGEDTGYEEAGDEGATEEYGSGENTNEYGNDEAYTEEGYEDDEFATNESLDNELLDSQETNKDLEAIIAGQNAEAPGEMPVVDTEVVEPETTEPVAEAPVMETPVAAAQPTNLSPALPELGSKMPYIVRVGETLSGIAQKIYGNQEMWHQMAELTSISNPNYVKPGDVVYYQLNESTTAFALAYEGTPKVEVTVQRGDTLAGIAQRVYGNQGDWKVVWRQNLLDNPDRLEVGQKIYYLAPEALNAALEYANSLTVAQIIHAAFGSETSKKEIAQQSETNNVSTSQVEQAPASQGSQVSDAPQTSVNGFELATNMFQHIVHQLI